MPKRRIHPPEFKAQVALDALCNQTTLAEVAARYALHPVQVCQWKQQLLKRLPELFHHRELPGGEPEQENVSKKLSRLERENADLAQEVEWLKKKLFRSSQPILRSLLEPGHPFISLRRQCELLGAARSSYYYRPSRTMQKSKGIYLLMDAIFCEDQFISQRALLGKLSDNGISACKNHLQRILCRLGFAPFERKLAKLLGSRLAVIPSPPYPAQEINGVGEQWILDIAYWPSPEILLFAGLLVDPNSSIPVAWSLSDHISPKLVQDLLQVAMDSHPLPLLLRCETYLPFLSMSCLRLLQEAGVSVLPPLWPEKYEGSGRNTALTPLWNKLKQAADVLRSAHSQAEEKWILQQAIRRCSGSGDVQGIINDPPMSKESKRLPT